jgi:hypothetical protein
MNSFTIDHVQRYEGIINAMHYKSVEEEKKEEVFREWNIEAWEGKMCRIDRKMLYTKSYMNL